MGLENNSYSIILTTHVSSETVVDVLSLRAVMPTTPTTLPQLHKTVAVDGLIMARRIPAPAQQFGIADLKTITPGAMGLP
ncbi:MAG: hypothetical protein R2825_06980 [Saprospiraceae bacterium]